MTDTTYDSLVYRVTPRVPGCPYTTVIQAIQDAAKQTAERTLAWRRQLPLYTLTPGAHEYNFGAPENTDVHSIFGAQVNGSPLEVLTLEQALEIYPAWADYYSGIGATALWADTPSSGFNLSQQNATQYNNQPTIAIPSAAVADAGSPCSLTQVSPDKFVVLPLPDNAAEYKLRMFVALRPKRSATSLPSEVMDELEDLIIHSALENLYITPDAHWASPELAGYHAKQYTYKVSERRARANLGNARGTLRARGASFS